MTEMDPRAGTRNTHEMAAKLLVFLMSVFAASTGEMALENITRLATGDLFSLVGEDCGPTRCMEASHGTALAALGDGCVCRCRRDTPAFREDRQVCVNHIDECLMASFGRGASKPQIPFVFLPQKGQIIYPSKEIIFTDVEDAICAVTSAQYLSASGWVNLRDLVDNDVPFGLYRDEGSTFLQWRGSAALHARLEGRLVAAHVLCSASTTSHMAASCAAFRVAGATQNALLDVRSIPFHAGEIMTTEQPAQNQGLSVLEALAIGVCVLMLIFIYAAGIIFYLHYKQKQKRKQKDPEQNMSSNTSENGSTMEVGIDMSNVVLKTNPLLKLGSMGDDFMHDNGFSDVSERTDDTIEATSTNNHNHNNHKKMNSNVISAIVHSRKIKKPPRPSLRQAPNSEKYNERFQRRSSSPDTFERAPQSDLSIVDCSVEDHLAASRDILSDGEPVIRRKLYFNPVFFETEHLKDPPPAAVEFLVKIREVMSIAKDKMTSKRFVPMLSDIPEEDLYQNIDLGWDFPCARRGRRFSAISLKQENSRRAGHCGGCPGCDSNTKPQLIELTRSNSCKTCVSEDYKQRIVRKWLDEVPTPSTKSSPIKSIAKVHGTPKTIEPQSRDRDYLKSADPISQKTESKAQEDTKISTKNPSKITESKTIDNSSKKSHKITESIPKKASKLTEMIPNIAAIMTEGIPNKNTKVSDSKPKKPFIDSVPKENPNLLVESVTNIESTDAIKINKTEDNGSKLVTSAVPHETKSSSKHASRRVRKKLPPPPPPPGKVSELVKADDAEPIPPEVKVKMEAVIRELNDCRRVEPMEIEEMKLETIQLIPAPKIVIPVVAADSHYFSDDNMLYPRRTDSHVHHDNSIDFDSLERTLLRRRRFSLACGPELMHREEFRKDPMSFLDRQRMASSWLDMNRDFEDAELPPQNYSHMHDRSQPVSEIFIGSSEPLYDNLLKPGPLTIEVRGSPVETRRHSQDDFDPDTLDRKPKRDVKKRVEKILLKSAGSFKYKSTSSESESHKKSPEVIFKNRIGNLRQIYESKANVQEEESNFYKRRGSLQYAGKDLTEFMKALKTPDLIRHLEGQVDPKPPIPPKYRLASDVSPKFGGSTRDSPPDRRRALEERDRFGVYSRTEYLNARRSGRRSARTRSRRTDLRKLHRTEDSGYMSTDSNESKRRAKYLMQLRPKNIMPELNMLPVRTVNKPPIVIESDTDDLESLCDGRSESGGESVETDSVFFGHFDDSKELLAELGLHTFEPRNKMMQGHGQIDSGFMGETNIILSGDSDSDHRSVISIMTGREGRPPGVVKKEKSPYIHTIEC